MFLITYQTHFIVKVGGKSHELYRPTLVRHIHDVLYLLFPLFVELKHCSLPDPIIIPIISYENFENLHVFMYTLIIYNESEDPSNGKYRKNRGLTRQNSVITRKLCIKIHSKMFTKN